MVQFTTGASSADLVFRNSTLNQTDRKREKSVGHSGSTPGCEADQFGDFESEVGQFHNWRNISGSGFEKLYSEPDSG